VKIKLLTNLGTRDADELGLDVQACTVDAELEVTDIVGQKLQGSGWCEVLAPTPPPVNAVPEKPAIAEAKKPAIAPAKDNEPKAADKAKSKPKRTNS
jgi:ribosomal protein L12E/L44/L45/RPP1/RPP2